LFRISNKELLEVKLVNRAPPAGIHKSFDGVNHPLQSNKLELIA